MFLTADQVFAAPIPTREVEVEEWGGSILVRSLSPRARFEIIDVLRADQDAQEAYDLDQAKPVGEREDIEKPRKHDESYLIVMFSVVGPDMKPIFKIDQYDEFVEKVSYPTVQHIFQQMVMLEARVPNAQEEQKKSSGVTRKSGSSSASRSRSVRR